MEGNNVSRVQVDIGTYEENENCPKIEGCITLNSQVATECSDMLGGLGLDKEYTEWTPVFVIDAVEGQEEALQALWDKVLTDEEYDGHLFKPPRKDICKGKATVKTCTSDGKVVIAVQQQQVLQQPKAMVGQMAPMFGPVLESTTQRIQFEASLGNNFEELMDLKETQNNSVFMALLNKAKGKLEVSLHPDLPDKMKDSAGEMMKQMGMPVDMIIGVAKLFNSLDVSFSFGSTEQLPDSVKEVIGKEMNEVGKIAKPRGKEWKESDKEVWEGFFNSMAGSANVYFVIPTVGRVHLSIRLPKLSTWLKSVQ